MSKKVTVTLADWVNNEILGAAKNKSEKVEELIIKGYLADKEKNATSNPDATPLYYNGLESACAYCDIIKDLAIASC